MAKNYSENTSNKILTHEMVAKEAAAMLVEESQFIKAINRSREKEFNKDMILLNLRVLAILM